MALLNNTIPPHLEAIAPKFEHTPAMGYISRMTIRCSLTIAYLAGLLRRGEWE
jgi:hypothetical protein